MDKFEKQIKKQYDQQLKPVNPKAAWANFEKERLGKQVKRKWIFLILLIIGLGTIGSWFIYYNSPIEIQDQKKILTEESVKRETLMETRGLSTQLIVNNENDNSHNKTVNSIIEKDYELSATILKEKGLNLKANSRVNYLYKTGINQSKEKEQSVAKNTDTVNESKKNNSKSYYSIQEIDTNEVKVTVKIDDEKLVSMVNATKLKSIEIIDLESIQNEKVEIKKGFHLNPQNPLVKVSDKYYSYGFYSGTNFLNHRFIRKSSGYNLGLVIQTKLTNRFSIYGIAGYSYMNFESRVNSKDLRIGSLNINTRRYEINSINKSLHQLNSGVEIAFWPVNKKKFGIDLTAGIVAKVDIEESNDYQVFENNMDSEIQQRNSLNYYYPAFYRVSTGINYSLNEVRIVLRPYYMHNVFSEETNHPFEWGINTEILF